MSMGRQVSCDRTAHCSMTMGHFVISSNALCPGRSQEDTTTLASSPLRPLPTTSISLTWTPCPGNARRSRRLREQCAGTSTAKKSGPVRCCCCPACRSQRDGQSYEGHAGRTTPRPSPRGCRHPRWHGGRAHRSLEAKASEHTSRSCCLWGQKERNQHERGFNKLKGGFVVGAGRNTFRFGKHDAFDHHDDALSGCACQRSNGAAGGRSHDPC